MAVRPLVRLGHPALRSPAERVEPQRLESPEIQSLIDDLVDTLRDTGGVGLAAPQVGVALQIFVYEVGSERRAAENEGTDGIPLQVRVNPMVEPRARELVYDWEGCLSIPGLRGLVPRWPEVKVDALDRHGRAVSQVAEGFEARIVQHEFDHLNGVVYLDRMRDLRSLSFEDEWNRFLAAPETDPDVAPAE